MIPKYAIACCALMVLLLGCAGLKDPVIQPPLPTDGPTVDPATIVNNLDQVNQDLMTFKGIGQIKIWRMNSLQSTRIAWAGYRFEKLRLEILGIAGSPLSSVAFDGSRFYLSLHSENRFYQKQTRRADLKRFISIPVSIPDILAILSGRVPLWKNASVSLIRSPRQNDHPVLILKKGWFRKQTAKIYLNKDLRTAHQYELFDDKNKLRYRVKYVQRRQYGRYSLPAQLQITDDQHTRIFISADRIWPDAEILPETFVLKPPT